MRKNIKQVLGYCEENFEKGNLETALRCAVSISIANPDAPEPYAHVTAYRILLTAANNRTITGEPDYYAVLGIKRASSFESIRRRCLEIFELLDGEVAGFKATSAVYDLISQGVAELSTHDRRRAYDRRSGFFSS